MLGSAAASASRLRVGAVAGAGPLGAVTAGRVGAGVVTAGPLTERTIPPHTGGTGAAVVVVGAEGVDEGPSSSTSRIPPSPTRFSPTALPALTLRLRSGASTFKSGREPNAGVAVEEEVTDDEGDSFGAEDAGGRHVRIRLSPAPASDDPPLLLACDVAEEEEAAAAAPPEEADGGFHTLNVVLLPWRCCSELVEGGRSSSKPPYSGSSGPAMATPRIDVVGFGEGIEPSRGEP